jgi:hypothetical protein
MILYYRQLFLGNIFEKRYASIRETKMQKSEKLPRKPEVSKRDKSPS